MEFSLKKEGGQHGIKLLKCGMLLVFWTLSEKKQLSNLKFVNTSVPRIKGRNKKLDKLPWMTTDYYLALIDTLNLQQRIKALHNPLKHFQFTQHDAPGYKLCESVSG